MAIGRPDAAHSLKSMQVFVAGKLVQRNWKDDDGNKRQAIRDSGTYVGPDLQFATAEVTKSSAEGLGSSSDSRSSADERQRA
jgi:single-stranded DNA-binding protein